MIDRLSSPQFALKVLVATAIVATAWSVSSPHDFAIWCFELLPGIAGVVGVTLLSRRFRFSTLLYYVIAFSFVMIAVGARYTYAEVPLMNWVRDALGLSRNYFDRVGHFVQGVTVGLLAREALLRTTQFCCRFASAFLTACVALAFSAFYELLEWWCVVLFYPDAGPEWLGMQGDPWDAQWDMSLALAGAVTGMLLLGRLHARGIAAVVGSDGESGGDV